MKLFDFLFYCLYRVFKLVKRVGERDENLASLFYSLLLSTNTIMLFFPLRYVFPKGYFNTFFSNLVLKVALGSIIIIYYFLCKSYFLQKGNDERIIRLYENQYSNSKAVVIGITYSLLTFISFITSAYVMSNYF